MKSPPPGPDAYTFGPFRLDVASRVLLRDREIVSLAPKAVETLLALVERAGRVVTRDELIAAIWPDTFVEPNNLAQHVSQLRRALADHDQPPRFIETISRRGYRFVSEAVAVRTPAARPATPSAPDVPPVRYTRSGDVNIAYQVVGNGPVDLVFVMGWVSHLGEFWTEPSFAAFLRRLASHSRLILFDKRGTGLSDRVADSDLPSLEQRIDDVRAVMEAAGSERAVLFGVSEGGPMSALFAATHVERTLGLIMFGTYARRLWAPDYPWAPTEEARQAFYAEIRNGWGGPVGIEDRAPSRAGDPAFREWWARYLRHGASPAAAFALTRMNAEIDVRQVLPVVKVPTLVLHRADDRCLRAAEGRYVAERIPGARFVELPGDDHLPFVGDQERLLAEIEGFLEFVRRPSQVETMLATIVVCAGDGQGDAGLLLAASVRSALDPFRGRLAGSDEGEIVALFDGPARGVRAARTLADLHAAAGWPVRVGVHTGECEAFQAAPAGPTLDIARGIAALARSGEVLVSRTTRDLVAGSGLLFEERGLHPLRPGDQAWRLYASA
jgi:pimeloyl-ACP methyl ester carboxylesterase